MTARVAKTQNAGGKEKKMKTPKSKNGQKVAQKVGSPLFIGDQNPWDPKR